MNIESFQEFREKLPPIEVFIERIRNNRYAFPGDCISTSTDFLSGVGAYSENQVEVDEKLGQEKLVKKHCSAVAGVVQPVNSVIYVQPIRNRYSGSVGDVVVGRILSSQQSKWVVDTGHRLDSVLTPANLNLKSGEQRIKTDEDVDRLKKSINIGDLVVCEVQTLQSDGRLSLYTRSLNFGKLGQGILVQVPPAMIANDKTHIHALSMGITIILPQNGWVFISPAGVDKGGFENNSKKIELDDREVMVRIRNCCIALTENRVPLKVNSIEAAYYFSLQGEMSCAEILRPVDGRSLANYTRKYLFANKDQESDHWMELNANRT